MYIIILKFIYIFIYVYTYAQNCNIVICKYFTYYLGNLFICIVLFLHKCIDKEIKNMKVKPINIRTKTFSK